MSEPGVCLGGGKCACRGDIGRERSFKLYFCLASLVAQTVEESARNVGYSGSIPGLGRSPGKGIHPHSSILAWKIPWTEEAGRATVHGVAKSQTQRSDDTGLAQGCLLRGVFPGSLGWLNACLGALGKGRLRSGLLTCKLLGEGLCPGQGCVHSPWEERSELGDGRMRGLHPGG